MPEPKTKKTKASVSAFIAAVLDETRRKDAKAIDKMFREITGEKPAMWGPSIIGYGSYETSTGTWPRLGFSPRKGNLALYVLSDFGVFALSGDGSRAVGGVTVDVAACGA